MKTGEKLSLCLLLLIVFAGSVAAQELITNVYGRNIHSLNGKWNAIIDLYDQGQRMKIYENRQPEGNIDFYEYAFEGGLRLNVPGDWNSQSPELKYYEGTVWYARHFDAKRLADKRQFLYFGAVSYRCKVYLNGKEIAEHEGGNVIHNICRDGRSMAILKRSRLAAAFLQQVIQFRIRFEVRILTTQQTGTP